MMRTWGACCSSVTLAASLTLSASLALLASAPAHADTCPTPEGGSAKLAAVDARERIDFLHRTVDDQARYARTWKWAWFAIGSATFASSAVQVAGWAAGNDVTREANIIDNLVVSAFSIVTPVTAILFALRVESDAPAIDTLLAQTGNGAAGSCLVLARIEELFAKDAAEEAFNTSWIAHVTGLIGLGAMFAIMAVEAATESNPTIRDAHWINAITNTAGGLILTEAQILTTPTGAANGYKRYLKGELPKKTATTITPIFTGLSLGMRISF